MTRVSCRYCGTYEPGYRLRIEEVETMEHDGEARDYWAKKHVESSYWCAGVAYLGMTVCCLLWAAWALLGGQ